MYNRIRRSLSKPSEIVIYIRDSWKRVWSYFFLLVLIALIPFLVQTVAISGFNTQTHQAIHNAFNVDLRGDYQISDYQLDLSNLDNNQSFAASIGDYAIYVNKTNILDLELFYFYLENQGISFYAFNFKVGFKSYSDLGLENYDFNDVSIGNVNRMAIALETVYSANRLAIKPFEIIVYIFIVSVELLIMTAIVSLFIIKPIPFKYKFKLNIYVATVYAIAIMLANLYNIAWISYIGIILMMIYSNRVFSRVISLNGK